MRIVATICAVLALAPVAAAGAMATSGRGDASVSRVGAARSAYGTILFDGRGFVLYAFTRDTPRRSACTGACAKAWPPYLVTGSVAAGRGAGERGSADDQAVRSALD
jgi:predicted lipoprotein with Yx(FWY)xxD motif